MAQELKGHVVDENGFEIEVWVENIPDSDVPEHVFLMYHGTQVGDFPFDNPTKGNNLEYEANRVAAGEAKKLSVFEDLIIDLEDMDSTWH